MPFDVAWPLALAEHPPPDDEWRDVARWSERHFRAAYERTETWRVGRFRAGRPDTTREPLRERDQSRPDPDGCRWGSGCDEQGTHGRWGPWWCEPHAERLARLREGAEIDWTAWQAWPKQQNEHTKGSHDKPKEP